MENKIYKLGDLLILQSKSKIKAGDALDNANYPFFTCSNDVVKTFDTAQYKGPALIFGTGGKASVHFCNDDFSTSTDCLTYYPINDEVDLSLINKYLRENIYLLENGFKGAGLKHISRDYIANIPIPLPPLETQKHIACVLDKASSIIEKNKTLLAKYELLIKSVFVQMFGDPIENPKGWEVKKLGDVCTKIGSGATPKGGRESYISEGISLVRSMNVYKGYFEYDGLAHITEKQAKELDNVTLQENDVLINITGASVARCCVLPKDVLPARVNQHVSILRPNGNLNSIYLANLLITDTEQKVLLGIGGAGGATREAITKSELENLSIPVPPLSLQNDFASFVEKVEQSKQKASLSLQKAQTLYKSLMQQYFG